MNPQQFSAGPHSGHPAGGSAGGSHGSSPGSSPGNPDSLHPVTVADVQLRQPLPFDVFDELGRLLLRAGFVVASDAQLARLIERGLFATQRSLDAVRAANAANSPTAPTAGNTPLPAATEAVKLQLWQQLATFDQTLMAGLAALGQGQGDSQPIVAAADEIRRLVDLDGDLMLASLFLAQGDDTRASHAMATGVVTQLLLGAGGTDAAVTASCVAAAICLDLVPAAGTIEAALRQGGVTDETWLGIASRHQQRAAGTDANPADPAIVAGSAVNAALDQYTALLNAASSYCTLIRPRGFVEALAADQAIKALVAGGKTPQAQDAARKLLGAVGVYPPGCAVVLANGEVGVVLRRTRHASGPVVKALRSPRGQNYDDGPKRLTSEPFFKIERMADFGKLGLTVSPERWWNTVVASGAPGVQALART